MQNIFYARKRRNEVHVRMAHWSCSPEYWGQDVDLFENGAVPIMRGHAGFVRAMLLGETNAERRIALTVWTSPGAYQSFVDSPDLEKITTMFSHMYVEGKHPGPVHVYEVRAQGSAD